MLRRWLAVTLMALSAGCVESSDPSGSGGSGAAAGAGGAAGSATGGAGGSGAASGGAAGTGGTCVQVCGYPQAGCSEPETCGCAVPATGGAVAIQVCSCKHETLWAGFPPYPTEPWLSMGSCPDAGAGDQ